MICTRGGSHTWLTGTLNAGGVEFSPLQHCNPALLHTMGGITASFGEWKSPISSTLLGAEGVQFESIAVCPMINERYEHVLTSADIQWQGVCH